MIQISQEPCAVIKHYKVRVVTYTTYDVFIIHNETTGEIEMTSDMMSASSYDECFESVVRIFKKQIGLNDDGKKSEEDLACLVDVGNQHVTLDLMKILDLTQKPEFDSKNQYWKNTKGDLIKIGKESGGADQIRFVFDHNNFEHLKRAIEISQNFQR